MKQRSIQTTLLVLLMGIAGCVVAHAQDPQEAYREFVRNRKTEMENWRTKANAEFSTYLSEAWSEFKILQGKENPMAPVDEKPTYYPGTEPIRGKVKGAGLPADLEGLCAVLFPEMISHPEEPGTGFDRGAGQVEFDFYGRKVMLPFDETMCLSYLSAKERDVAQAWSKLGNASFDVTLKAIQDFSNKYALNGWANYMLIKRMTEAIYADSQVNERLLTQMFFLCQLQYRVRVGSAGSSLVLLLPFQEPIYQVPYISDGGQDLFIFSSSPLSSQTPLYTFTRDFSHANNLISLAFDTPIMLGNEDTYRMVTLPLWADLIGESVEVPVNAAQIEFVYDYPQTDLPLYHKSAVNQETSKKVLRSVKYQILARQLSEVEAVSYILSLVQKGFEYKTDYEMFGRAKPLFVEESIYYGANNCKDRVLLFSWLVREILGLKTVMFGYPNHVSCGVAFTQPVQGDVFSFEGKQYWVCDPTYIGAPIGASMPRYAGTEPVIVRM